MQLDVWRIDLRAPLAGAAELLSPDEAERAARFASVRDREKFAGTRAALRSLAGTYVGIPPEEVRISYGAKGKPEVAGLSFNVSHAGDVALAAFAPGAVGVDVEEKRPDVELTALARRFFTGAENDALDALGPAAYVDGFYGCWTRKEAFVKALGEGLSFELDRVEVSVHPEPARVVSIDGDAEAAARWTMADVDAGEGYAGAVAVEAVEVDVCVRDWPGLRVVAR